MPKEVIDYHSNGLIQKVLGKITLEPAYIFEPNIVVGKDGKTEI